MREENKDYFLGCSGYFYWHWKGRFYPENLEPKGWLRYYSEHFNTVEINATFYRFPKKSSLKRAVSETPDGFVFSVKMNRAVTHQKKLLDCDQLVEEFYSIVSDALGEKLGPVLFQLPPSFRFSEENLSRVLNAVRSEPLTVIEFRHKSWWREEVYRTLQERGIVFCTISMKGLPDDLILTGDTLYIRFHGLEGKYRYRYSENELEDWARRISSTPAKRVFVYFNNDYNANAPENCRMLGKMLGIM